MQNFIYLSVLIQKIICMKRSHIMSANKAYYSLNSLFKSRLISRMCKLTLYKTIIRSILCYNPEIWTLSATKENSLRIFKRRILRKIFGPVKDENNVYRIRFNYELQEIIGYEHIAKFIKAQKIRQAGYLERMDGGGAPRRTSEMVCMSTRRHERPRMGGGGV